MPLSYAWYFKNDTEKLQQLLRNINVSPLGSGALAGNPFNIDRFELAYKLGFDSVTQNSMQAVGDRDFVGNTKFARKKHFEICAQPNFCFGLR